MPEIWDLYTLDGKKTGETIARNQHDEVPEGRFHMWVQAWIRNSKGQYIFSQRAADKDTEPLLWECVSGHSIAGETSRQAVVREVFEELGIRLRPEDGKHVMTRIRDTIDGVKHNNIQVVYLFESEESPNLSLATTPEVEQSKWMTLEEIKALYDAGKTAKNVRYIFDLVHNPPKDYSDIIGSTVKGHIDRPLGSRHPRHPHILYPINYGYVDGVIAGDGKEQDIYLMGIDKPVDTFEGKVIAVYHRYDDVEDKWIVSADGRDYSDAEIYGRIEFQEQYFFGILCR